MKHAYRTGLAVAAIGVVALVYAALEPLKLIINGNAVETDVIVKNGKSYVPVADVAKALGYTVNKSAGTLDLEPAGGANQVEGLNGKIGQLIRTPIFTFVVQKVVFEEHHQKVYTSGTSDARDGETLAVIYCRLKNASQKALFINPFGGDLTALTDQDEHTLSNQYSGGGSDVPSNREVLPGSAYDFTLIFGVPKDVKLRDLVYQFDGGIASKPVLRISLAQP